MKLMEIEEWENPIENLHGNFDFKFEKVIQKLKL